MTTPCQHEDRWGALGEWQRGVGEKLETIQNTQATRFAEILEQTKATNGRMRKLERTALVLGTAVATSIVTGAAGPKLGTILEHLLALFA